MRRTPLKKALILVNPYSTLISAINQPIRLKEEFKKLGVEVDIKPNSIDTAIDRKSTRLNSSH